MLRSEQAPLIYENGVYAFLKKWVRTDQKVDEVSIRTQLLTFWQSRM